MPNIYRPSLCCLGVLIAGTLSASTARADSNIRVEMNEVAKSISALLKDMGHNQVEIQDFQFKGSDSKLKGAAGPGIANFLSEELQKMQISVKKDAPIQIRGTYVDVIDSKSKFLAAQIKGEVLEGNAKVLTTFTRGIFGDQALASLFGATTNLPPKGGTEARDKKLLDALDNPKVEIKNSRITVDKTTPYAIELLVRRGNDFVPLSAMQTDGQAFVKINRDDEYAVKLINDSDSEAAVALTIDGLSMFNFSENKNYKQVIIGAKSAGLIKGWHRSNTVSDAFLVTEYSKSAVAKALPSSTSVGVITAAFSVCFPDDVPPPEDEPSGARGGSLTENATGLGRKLAENFNEVKRTFGVLRTTISVRYSK
jgi:hypothetical protein